MNLELDPDVALTPLPHDLRCDIDGTAARDGVDPQKWQPKYGCGAGSRSGFHYPTSSKVRHRWDCTQTWSGPSNITTQIWMWSWIQIWNCPPI